MNKVADVHVAHMPTEINNCAASLELAPSANYHHFEAHVGNILSTRRQGFRYGDLPYVGYVDPDDEIIGDPWTMMAGILDRGEHSIVYTNSLINSDDEQTGTLLYEDHVWTPHWHWSEYLPIHQLVLIRRDLLEIVMDEIYLNARLVQSMKYRANNIIYTYLVRKLPAFFLNQTSCIWNRLGNNAHLEAKPIDYLYQHDHKQNLRPLSLR